MLDLACPPKRCVFGSCLSRAPRISGTAPQGDRFGDGASRVHGPDRGRGSWHEPLQDLRATMPSGMTRPIGVKPEGSKVDRMAAQSAKIEAGHVHLPKSAAWLGEFLTELLSFPNGRHDDQVDSVSQFLRWLQNAYLNQISFHVPFVVS